MRAHANVSLPDWQPAPTHNGPWPFIPHYHICEKCKLYTSSTSALKAACMCMQVTTHHTPYVGPQTTQAASFRPPSHLHHNVHIHMRVHR